MSDNLPTETVPPTLSGPDAPRFPPITPGVVVDLALIESLNLTNAEEQAASAARAAEIVADAEARAAKLIAAAVADAEEQVADVRPRAEADAEKIVQQAKDEASEVERGAQETAADLITQAERRLEEAEDRAAEIVANAESEAMELRRTLEIDRELVSEKLETLAARESDLDAKHAEADRTLAIARQEAERMTTEAGEAVDRMMRSGQMVAEAQRDAYHSDQEALSGMQAQHASDLRELTERYETKVSNQNIENLELRQELETLREAVETLRNAQPTTPRKSGRKTASAPADEPTGDRIGDGSTHDDFVSPWMVPEEPEEVPAASEVAFDSEETEGEMQEEPEATDEKRSMVGPATGLAPNARLVEPLQASAFRPADDPKKRKRRKR